MRNAGRIILVMALGLTASGCYRMKMGLVDASVQKPSNVALFFSMDDQNGNPVPGVQAEQFKIYEDRRLISVYESKQTILNPEVSTERFTLLLLDMSGSVVDSGQVPMIQSAASAFLEDIPENEKVAIFAFDGREDIQPIAPFSSREESLSRKNELLQNWQGKDPSTNLNGAIIQATQELENAKFGSKVPLRFGTLVIFTDGTDQAHRASAEEAVDALYNADNLVFVIGLGGEVDENEMRRFGKDGVVLAQDRDLVVTAFEEVAERINAHALRYYLLSYCSPSRAGVHELTVVAEANGQKGRLVYEFDATGFGPQCDPNKTPAFKFPEPVKDSNSKHTAPPKKRAGKSSTTAVKANVNAH
jgi:hypothetical protein